MSVDFYLLPGSIVGSDAENARLFLDEEKHRRPLQAPDEGLEHRKRELAKTLLGMRPSFLEFAFNFEEIARFENISIAEARRKYRHIEINGPHSSIQFLFFDRHISVHCYSGMTSEEIEALLLVMSVQGDFVVFDPQSNRVFDVRTSTFSDSE